MNKDILEFPKSPSDMSEDELRSLRLKGIAVADIANDHLIALNGESGKSMLTGAVCPYCKLHKSHKVNCPSNGGPVGDFSIAAYREMLGRKVVSAEEFGFEIDISEIHPLLKPHQKVGVKWGVRGGRRALFEQFGLGKTLQQLEIIRLILKHAGGGRGLIVAPLGVAQEFQADALKIGINLKFIRTIEECGEDGIYLTNYESVRDGKLDPAHFVVASLDEAAVLSGFGGVKTFREFMRLFDTVKYRFVATATPDANEYIELLAFAAFLGVMDVSAAKTRFFKRDSTKADHLTIHPHKIREFWMWVSTWALFLSKPSDLGEEFSDIDYDLPEMMITYHEIKVDHSTARPEKNGQGRLVRNASMGLSEAASEKRDWLDDRVTKASEIIAAEPDEHWLIWHDLEDERAAIKKRIPGVVDVYGMQRASKQGSQDLEQAITGFSNGTINRLAAKPSMFGAGANFQRHCCRAVFCGINYSFRNFIQAIHRIYRFLQTREVHIHIIFAESERGILDRLLEKWDRHKEQLSRMLEIMREYGLSVNSLRAGMTRAMGVDRTAIESERFVAVNNDCVEELHRMPSNSVHMILTSPPFSHMYEYSPNWADFGHSDNNEHFFEQMGYLTPQLLRVLQPGRICAVHVKDRIVPGGVNGLGFQTIYPFHVDCIQHFVKHGFGFTGFKTVVTDVVRENNQTYRLGWTEQCKDGTKMGYGMSEFMLYFRKPPTDTARSYADTPVVKLKPMCISQSGEMVSFDRNLPIQAGSNYSRSRWQIDAHGYMRSSGDRLLEPHDFEGLSHAQIFKLFRKSSFKHVYDFERHVRLSEYLESKGMLPVGFMLLQPQSWHSDVWTDITRMRTLNMTQASKGKEMHLAPMQLDVANRTINQLTMKDEVVLDCFGGIGTVGFCAVSNGRRAISIELSPSYYLDGLGYMKAAELKYSTPTLFDMISDESEDAVDLPEIESAETVTTTEDGGW